MNSFKAEEISLASFGHLIAYAKLFSSFFRHIIFSHMSHLGNFAVFMTLLGMLSISQAVWIAMAELGIYFWGAMYKIFYCVYEI